MSTKPLLSILIPAYCYPNGIYRILTGLRNLTNKNIEVIIFDDSLDSGVKDIIKKFLITNKLEIKYKKNNPSLGAVHNWNALLDAARGDYCLLLHHDEFPIGENFAENLMDELRNQKSIDILILDCIIIKPQFKKSYRHSWIWLKSIIIKRFPSYLFRRNIIGPASVVIIRRSLYPRYNINLKWLVDIEVYYRALIATKNISISSNIRIGHILEKRNSITAMLGSSIKKIKKEELDFLKKKYFHNELWIKIQCDHHLINILIRFIESILWYSLKILMKISGIFKNKIISISDIDKINKL